MDLQSEQLLWVLWDAPTILLVKDQVGLSFSTPPTFLLGMADPTLRLLLKFKVDLKEYGGINLNVASAAHPING